VAATLAGAILAVIPVLLGGSMSGMAIAAQYSWFIGCGVGFGLYYLLATRGSWKMTPLKDTEPAF
jgi:nucleobase:cation symporter-1, NCS1 family